MDTIKQVASVDEHDEVEGSDNVSLVIPDDQDKSSGTPQHRNGASNEVNSAEASEAFAPSTHKNPSESSEDDSSISDSNTDSTPKASTPAIVYKTQYKNIMTSDIVFATEAQKPLLVQKRASPSGVPVLEIITCKHTSWDRSVNRNKDWEPTDSEPPPVHGAPVTSMKINSLAIINALKSVIEYYPGQSFTDEEVLIRKPYDVLVHHENELTDLRQRYAPGAKLSEEEKCERTVDTYEHLGILGAYLQDTLGDSVQAERQRHARGVCTFEMLWLLLKPGIDVYHDERKSGNFNGYVVHSTLPRVGMEAFVVHMWLLEFNGEYLGRRIFTSEQRPFDGERDIRELDAFPCEFLENDPKEKKFEQHRRRLEERGEMYFRLTSRQCMDFRGTTTTYPQKNASLLHATALDMLS